MPVVIRFIEVFCLYYICHAGSYQNAFRSSVNGFATRAEAERFAAEQNCTVERHDHDPLQIN